MAMWNNTKVLNIFQVSDVPASTYASAFECLRELSPSSLQSRCLHVFGALANTAIGSRLRLTVPMFEFSGNHRTIIVRVEQMVFNCLTVPLDDADGAIANDGQASRCSPLFDPFVEIRACKRIHRQYFERGAAGTTIYHLSPCFSTMDSGPFLRAGCAADG